MIPEMDSFEKLLRDLELTRDEWSPLKRVVLETSYDQCAGA